MVKCDEKTCPITENMDISRSKPQEKLATAKALYATGDWSMERIAEKLGESLSGVQRMLADFNLPKMGNSKRKRTATNPKGAGRKKGSKTKPAAGTETAAAMMDAGAPTKDIAAELGVSTRRAAFVVREEKIRREAEPTIDPDTLGMPQKQKLEIAKRQQERELKAEFEQRVAKEVERRIAVAFPHLKEKQRHADAVVASYTPPFSKSDCNDVARVLHPDTWNAVAIPDELRQRLTKAFVLFSKMQRLLCIERSRATA